MLALGYHWYMTSVDGAKNVCETSYKPQNKVLGIVPKVEVFVYSSGCKPTGMPQGCPER